jgi:hypothetical protein
MDRHSNKGRILLATGLVLLLGGLLGFLAASVALARAQDPPALATELPGRLELDPEDPLVQTRRRQAESVLFGSLLAALAGAGTVFVALRMRRAKGAGGGG